MITITYILATVILLGLCIFIHELGHLLGGKMVGIKAKVFSIGMGKGIIKKKIGDTTFQIAPIPFGGYCQFYGEDPTEERKGKSYEFLSAHPMKRVVTVIMGPVFNLLFGIVIFFIMNLVGYTSETNQITIPEFLKTGEYTAPAYQAGLKDGDRIIKINNKHVVSFSDIQSNVMFSEGRQIQITVDRGGKAEIFPVTPKKYTEKDHYTIGVLPYGNKVLILAALKDDVAFRAGIKERDEVKSINGKPVTSQKEFTDIVRANPGKEIQLQLIRAGSGNEETISVIPRMKEVITARQLEDGRFKGEKLDTFIDKMDLVKSAIAKRKLKINDKVIDSFSQLKEVLKVNSKKVIKLTNSGGDYYGQFNYEAYGFIGVETAVSPDMIKIRYGVIEGFWRSLVEPYNFIVMNLKGMGMLIAGKLDVRENLSGPIRIARIAGQVAYYNGLSAFILLMAKISVILMVMNLLPIPAVDGSFILIFLFEAIRGKPLSEKLMQRIQYLGIALLIIIGLFVIFNDLSFLPFFQKLFN